MVREPLYERIERELRRRVGELDEGERIPSEPQLAAEFGVSRMTARAAVTALERDGLLDRIPGRGSFVRRAQTVRRVAELVSFHDEAVSTGKTPHSRVVSAGVRVPTAEESHALGGPHEVVAIVRVRCMNDVPVAIEEAVFVPELVALLDIDLERASLHTALRTAGRAPATGSSTLSARAAGQHAGALDIDAATALLVETRTVRDAEGQPIEFTTSAYVPSRYALGVEFTIAEPSR